MSNRHSKGNRDKNEPEFRQVMDLCGVGYIALSDGDGADFLLLTTPMVFLEVKNPAQKPSDRALTACEKALQTECLERGIGYLVYEYAEQINEYLVRCVS